MWAGDREDKEWVEGPSEEWKRRDGLLGGVGVRLGLGWVGVGGGAFKQ